MRVLIVSSSFYNANDLANELREALDKSVEVETCFRDYHFNDAVHTADLIVSDGTCKSRDEQGVISPIVHDVRASCKEHGKLCIASRYRGKLPSARRVRKKIAKSPSRHK